MGIFSDIGDWFTGGDDSSASGGGTPDSWYSVDSVADTADDYSSLFTLDGTSTVDPGFWNTVLDVGGAILRSPITPGIIGGLANGYQNYQDAELKEDYLKQQQANINTTNARITKHNETINTPPPDGLYKQVKVLR